MKDNIISEEVLPVSIRVIKVGKKQLTKSLLQQVPIEHFIQHNSVDYSWLMPGIRYWEDIEGGSGLNMDFVLNGQLLGFVNVKLEDDFWIEGYINNSQLDTSFYCNHIERNYYHILFVDRNNRLCRSYISQQQAEDSELELEQIYV